jgi:hypothetical protein
VREGGLAAGRDPIHHLRLFANYLTPRKGLFSADTWVAATVVSRNLLLTWLLLLPALVAVLMMGQLYFVAQPFDDAVVVAFTGYDAGAVSAPGERLGAATPSLAARAAVAARPVLVVAALIAFMTILWMKYNNAGVAITHYATLFTVLALLFLVVGDPLLSRFRCEGPRCGADSALITVALVVGALLWWWVWSVTDATPGGPRRQVRASHATHTHAALVAILVVFCGALFLTGFARPMVDLLPDWGATVKQAGAAVAGVLATLASLFTALKATPAGGRDARELGRPSIVSRAIFAVTPTLVLLVLSGLAAWLAHRVIQDVVSDFERRSATLTIAAVLGTMLCVIFAAYEVVDGAFGPGDRRRKLDWLPTLLLLLVAALGLGGFALEPLMTLWRKPAPSYGISWVGPWWAVTVVASLALVATTVVVRRNRSRVYFLSGFCVVALLLLQACLARLPDFYVGSPGDLRSRPLYVGVALITILGAWVIAVGWMADPNALSLHTFYRTRLVRAYLGASNSRRSKEGKDIGDSVGGDDLLLKDVVNCERGGPYHLVNTTLNLVGGRDLSAAQRSSAAFLLSPLYCGSVRTGYRPTAEYMSGQLSLGAAVAASGAAVSPNMGSRTPPASLVMLLAFLNVRLGFWAPSPHMPYWDLPQTRLWPYYLLRESLSQTTELGSYCYLTDGGHFDNTGLYALVERGCRFIVFIDSGADPAPSFEDLGEAIRRCRIDFRAEFQLDVAAFRPTEASRVEGGRNSADGTAIRRDEPTARSHFVVGTIAYDRGYLERLRGRAVAAEELEATLVWFRPSLTLRESADVRQYALENRAFPQQATTDQWFDESQFESYRKLGESCADEAFRPLNAARSIQAKGRGPLAPSDLEDVFREISRPLAPRGRLAHLAWRFTSVIRTVWPPVSRRP